MQYSVFSIKKSLIIKSILIVTILYTAYGILHTPQAFAQQVSLSISPPLIELAIKPGKSLVIAYTISNLGDPVILSSSIRSFLPLGKYGGLVVQEEFSGPIRFELDNSNIKLEKPYFLKSQEGQQLLLNIRVPEGTPEGDYYYTFISTSAPGKIAEGTSSSKAIGSIGSNILITVTDSGSVNVNGNIEEFAVIPRYALKLFGKTYNIFESTDTIPIRLVINNKGQNLIKPYGEIKLSGSFGERSKYDILPQNILKESSRLVIATPSADLKNVSTSLNISGFFVGKYYLTSSINFGDDTDQLSSGVSFYALPIKLLIATIIAIVISVFVIRKMNKNEPI